jgi:hypothetical protein
MREHLARLPALCFRSCRRVGGENKLCIQTQPTVHAVAVPCACACACVTWRNTAHFEQQIQMCGFEMELISTTQMTRPCGYDESNRTDSVDQPAVPWRRSASRVAGRVGTTRTHSRTTHAHTHIHTQLCQAFFIRPRGDTSGPARPILLRPGI